MPETGRIDARELLTRHYLIFLGLGTYLAVFLFCRVRTLQDILYFQPISRDAFDVLNAVWKNLSLPFEAKNYHSYGPFSYLLTEGVVRLWHLGAAPSFVATWKIYQFLCFLSGMVCLTVLYGLLRRYIASTALVALGLAALLVNETFLRYSLELHPDVIMLAVCMLGFYASVKFFEEYWKDNRINYRLLSAALFCFALGYFTKRTPLIFIVADLGLFGCVVIYKRRFTDLFDRRVWLPIMGVIGFIVLATYLVNDYNKEYSFVTYLNKHKLGVVVKAEDQMSLPFYYFFRDTFSPTHLPFFITLFFYPAFLAVKRELDDNSRVILYFWALFIVFVGSLFKIGWYGVHHIRYAFLTVPIMIVPSLLAMESFRKRLSNRAVWIGILVLCLGCLVYQVDAQKITYSMYLYPKGHPVNSATDYLKDILDKNPKVKLVVGKDEYVLLFTHPNLQSFFISKDQCDFDQDPLGKPDLIFINMEVRDYRDKVNQIKDIWKPINCLRAAGSGYQMVKKFQYNKDLPGVEIYLNKDTWARINVP
ncbi:MAG: hypothetical protein HQK58_01010 [Deltaproteobacteria bacterium]|nr:hypothetical protein [Deltaproteobacteria bacterium]